MFVQAGAIASVTLSLIAVVAVSVMPAETPVKRTTKADMRKAERVVLANRLLDSSCVLKRQGFDVQPLGACRQAFDGAHRIRHWRAKGDRVTLTDALGSAVLDFAWNDETGMASVSTPAVPEAGALALLPVKVVRR